MGAYDDPEVYELAFGFVDIPKQVDLLTKLIEKHSGVEVHRVLDLGCGPSPQLREFARRGYEVMGLDLSPGMLALFRKRAAEDGVKVEAVEANMVDFKLGRREDLLLCFMGTISLVGSRENMRRHIASVASSLRPGGLYIIENYRQKWSPSESTTPQTWEAEGDGVLVRMAYRANLKDRTAGTIEESITLEVDDHCEKRTIMDLSETVIITIEELASIAEGKLELVGLFDHTTGEPAEGEDNFNYVLLRRL